MITLLHGDNQVLSRQKLNDLLTKAQNEKKEIIKLDGLQINLNALIQSLTSTSLFGLQKLLVIENLFSRINSKEKGNIISYLKKEVFDYDIIFWEKKEIPGTTTRWLPKSWVNQIFKISPAIFKLLDSLKPKNNQVLINYFHLSLRQENTELVFYLLTRRFRELIKATTLGNDGMKGAPWQINKIINQSKGFTLNYLKDLYQKLLHLDYDIKTGTSIMPLEWHLDLFFANL